MTRPEFVALLAELMECDANSLTPSTFLADVGAWDSLAVIGFIAMVDERLGASVPAQSIYACETVDDLLNLVAEHLT